MSMTNDQCDVLADAELDDAQSGLVINLSVAAKDDWPVADPQATATPPRYDPYKNFHFRKATRVDFDNRTGLTRSGFDTSDTALLSPAAQAAGTGTSSGAGMVAKPGRFGSMLSQDAARSV